MTFATPSTLSLSEYQLNCQIQIDDVTATLYAQDTIQIYQQPVLLDIKPSIMNKGELIPSVCSAVLDIIS